VAESSFCFLIKLYVNAKVFDLLNEEGIEGLFPKAFFSRIVLLISSSLFVVLVCFK
jgi:hypothetical protein